MRIVLMSCFSLDLRERIVAAYEEGNTSIRKVAERFKVSKSVVQNLLNLKREKGDITPKKATGGQKDKLAGYEEEIVKMVTDYPDYTLAEYCEYWEETTGMVVSVSSMFRFLTKQNLTLKKKHDVIGKRGQRKDSARE
jgi:putative transposase